MGIDRQLKAIQDKEVEQKGKEFSSTPTVFFSNWKWRIEDLKTFEKGKPFWLHHTGEQGVSSIVWSSPATADPSHLHYKNAVKPPMSKWHTRSRAGFFNTGRTQRLKSQIIPTFRSLPSSGFESLISLHTKTMLLKNALKQPRSNFHVYSHLAATTVLSLLRAVDAPVQ